MENQNTEGAALIVKVLTYTAGVVIGVAAKLATINMEKKLTWKEFMFHTTLAMGCAWVVYFAFHRIGQDDVAIIASVIVGRFGDSLLLAIAKGIRRTILNLFQGNE